MKSRVRSLHSLASKALLLSFAVLPSIAHTAPLEAQAAAPRVVTGRVADKANQPVRNAVVYLKDDHSLAVKSFIADEAGGYRFGQLSQNTDYELWAEADGKKSAVKTISSFETKTAITVNLKIDK